MNAPQPDNPFKEGPQELPPQSRALAHLNKKLAGARSEGPKSNQIRKLLKKALLAFKSDDYQTCCQLALQALDLDEHHPQANHVLAVGLERLGELAKAIKFYERALELDPTDYEIYFNLGLVAWRLKLLEAAERLFRIYIEHQPDRAEGYNNLGGVLRDQNRFENAIELLRGAIYQFPEDPQLWNSLGTVLFETGQLNDALTFFKEAIRLKPDYARAHHNIGYLYNHLGPCEEALAAYERALALPQPPEDRAESEHARALALVQLGRLDEGFSAWHVRIEHRYRMAPTFGFRLPFWNGEPLEGKKILLVAEQGIGDEIMLAHAIPDIIEEVGAPEHVFIACSTRLVHLFARSFPKAITGPYVDGKKNDRLVRSVPWIDKAGQIDYWAPFGSLLRWRRASVADFAGKPAFLKADPERVEFWRARLREIGPGPNIGISWKSLVMGGNRAKFYTRINQWAPVLTTPGVNFVNIQYGDCADELAEAQEQFGVTIHNFEDLDIKNNIDDNAALCTALDLAISAPNAAAQIAGSVGTEVWFIAIGNGWPQLGTDHVPWYPNTRMFEPQTYGDFDDGLARAAEALREWAGRKREAA